MKNQKYQQGVSMYLAFVLMTILLGIALGISGILISEIKIIRRMGNSVIAFYAADTGIEQVLLNRANPVDIPDTFLANGAHYYVSVRLSGGDCPAANYCVKSIGIYQETRRAIEIGY